MVQIIFRLFQHFKIFFLHIKVSLIILMFFYYLHIMQFWMNTVSIQILRKHENTSQLR